MDAEQQCLVLRLVQAPARGLTEARLKTKVAGWYNAFSNPADLCPADALVRSLLIDLGTKV